MTIKKIDDIYKEKLLIQKTLRHQFHNGIIKRCAKNRHWLNIKNESCPQCSRHNFLKELRVYNG